jgi:hypothetical protein
MNKYIVAGILLILLAAGIYGLNKTSPQGPSTNATSTPSTSTAPNPNVVSYGQVTLRLGESARFADLTVTPLSVTEDSRCPQGVQCVWAGTVRVNVRIVSGMGTSTQIIELGKSVTTEAEEVSLIGVTPVPVSGSTIASADYRIVFLVAKRPVSSINPPAMSGCYIGGCSSQICSDEPNAMSTCEYREEYACYRTAKCERQSSGQCGWTQTADLQMCLNAKL